MKRGLSIAMLCLCIAIIPPIVRAARKEKLTPEQQSALAKLRGPLAGAVDKEPLTVLELADILNERRSGWPDKVEIQPRYAAATLRSLRATLVSQIQTRYPDFDREPEKEDEPLIMKTYDVSDIILSFPDYSPPLAGLGGAVTMHSGGGGAIIDLGDDDSGELSPGIGSEELFELIEVQLKDESEEGSIRYTNGQFIVRKTKSVHDKLIKFFALLREQLGYVVTMEVKFLRINRTHYRNFLKKHNILVPGHFTSEMLEELLSGSGEDKPVEVVTNHELTAYEGQSVVLREGRQVALVTDYEVSTSGVIPVMNSVIQNINEGIIVGLTPIITGDRKSIHLTVKGNIVKLREPVEEVSTKDGPIQQPHIDITRLRSTFRIPDRRISLVGGVFTGPDATGDPMLITVRPIIGRLSRQK
ncbi:MAG: hypothetical protein ACYS8W_12050 [Planctomycetota bacterium]|jgi:hypothetical protein